MYCRPLAGTIPFRVPIEICAARSCKVNSKGTGVAVVFVKTRQTCPSVSTGDIIQDIGKGGRANKENARLDSWTVGSRRPCRESSLLVRPGDERKRRGGSTGGSAVTSSFHGVGGTSLSSYRLCFWVDRVAHRHLERPAGLSLTPFDVVSGPPPDKH